VSKKLKNFVVNTKKNIIVRILGHESSPFFAFISESRFLLLVFFLISFFVNILAISGSIYSMQIYDRILIGRSEASLLALTLMTIIFISVYASLEFLRSSALTSLGRLMGNRLSSRVFELLFDQATLHGAERNGVQPLRDLEIVRAFISTKGLTTLLDLPWIPMFLGFLYFIHPMFGFFGIFAVAIMIIGTLIQSLFHRRSFTRSSDLSVESYAFVENSLRSAEATEAMGMRLGIWTRWRKRHEEMLGYQKMATRLAGGFTASVNSLQLIFPGVLIISLGAYLVIEQEITAGTMFVASFLLQRALTPSFQAVTLWQSAANARSAHQRLCAFMSSGVVEKKGMELPAPKGALSVENLMLSIPGSRVALLRGVTFSLQAGESLAIVGGSGAGKSTLARGMLGIWPPSGGAVRLDGADLSRMPREQVGRYIGYLPQDVELFEGSVAENIARLGDVDAEKVVAAATAAGLHELVLRLPQGYDTQLGAGGRGLSPGQRQRIGLARALYDEPRFIVLDEPNSNLDSAGEAALSTALEGLRASGVTTVTITHRPNILTIVDKILLLRDGQVEAFGPREEIMPRLTRPAKIARPVKAIANS